jgi:protein-L-isoaspartate(D-aspartate) O-methyltransferase
MVIPVGDQYAQDLIKIIKDRRGVRHFSLGGCRFVKLIGEEGWRAG